MLDWLVIGGGPHGVHAGVRVAASWSGVRVAILDPHESPFHEWDAVTRALGMTHLRSPVVHHIGRTALELADFAREWASGRPGSALGGSALRGSALKGRYRRPSLDLFGAHARRVFDASGLDRGWTRGRAYSISRIAHGWRVETDRGALDARRVVLALGSSSRVRWPGWAPRGTPYVSHVLDPARAPVAGKTTLVVGGGLSAVQAAVSLASPDVEVTLLSRHIARVHRFDTEPGWLGPKLMRGFQAEPSPNRRRAIISDARHVGSITSDALHALRAAASRRELATCRGSVRSATVVDGGIDVVVERADRDEAAVPERLRVQRLLLATGYDADASSPPWIRAVGARLGLPVARCGTPVPDVALQWAPGLHVMGPLAELELGPTARNLAGARRAGDVLAVVAERSRPAAVATRSA